MKSINKKQKLVELAENIGRGHELVLHNGNLYLPLDYETGDYSVVPDADRTMWQLINDDLLLDLMNLQYDIVFDSDGQRRNWQFMVLQHSRRERNPEPGLLLRTPDGLQVLKGDGKLYPHDGKFRTNSLPMMVNDDPDDKQQVFDTLVEWLDVEEVAISLLRHVATMLAPHYSAVKYVLLIGSGRNGKSVFLEMLTRILGPDNYSGVKRGQLLDSPQVASDLVGKLANIVMDGPLDFLKDSSMEKSLVSGEEIQVRMLWGQKNTQVRSNALFIEGLNKEPNTSDKSPALQARLARFRFPNTYPEDPDFRATMLSDRLCGALLSLLIDYYVEESQRNVLLVPTKEMMQENLNAVVDNTTVLRWFRDWLRDGNDPDTLIGKTDRELWDLFFTGMNIDVVDRVDNWPERRLKDEFQMLGRMRRSTERVNGQPTYCRRLDAFSTPAKDLIALQKEAEDEAVVDE